MGLEYTSLGAVPTDAQLTLLRQCGTPLSTAFTFVACAARVLGVSKDRARDLIQGALGIESSARQAPADADISDLSKSGAGAADPDESPMTGSGSPQYDMVFDDAIPEDEVYEGERNPLLREWQESDVIITGEKTDEERTGVGTSRVAADIPDDVLPGTSTQETAKDQTRWTSAFTTGAKWVPRVPVVQRTARAPLPVTPEEAAGEAPLAPPPAEGTPWYKQPAVVVGGAVVAALGLWLVARGRKG